MSPPPSGLLRADFSRRRWMAVVMSRESQAFVEWLMGQFKRPDYLLSAARYYWQDTYNPVYVWWAIETCACRDTQIQFPEWVCQYLAGCAQRMLSPDAASESDLRKILPQIMGFPRKRGRGNPLDMGKSAGQYDIPAMRFAIEIEGGAKPTAALRSAFEFLDAGVADKMDEKTLLSHIKKHFEMPNAPRTNAEWKRAIRAWAVKTYGPFIREYREISS